MLQSESPATAAAVGAGVVSWAVHPVVEALLSSPEPLCLNAVAGLSELLPRAPLPLITPDVVAKLAAALIARRDETGPDTVYAAAALAAALTAAPHTLPHALSVSDLGEVLAGWRDDHDPATVSVVVSLTALVASSSSS